MPRNCGTRPGGEGQRRSGDGDLRAVLKLRGGQLAAHLAAGAHRLAQLVHVRAARGLAPPLLGAEGDRRAAGTSGGEVTGAQKCQPTDAYPRV